jgi:microcystin synthetase protein McyB
MQPEIRRVVAEEWQVVLGVDGVEVTDNFFESGGDSMRALELMRRVDARLGHAFPLQVLFSHGGFADLVAAVESSRPVQ